MERFPTYVISLEQAKDKFEKVERDFSAIGVPVQRFPGVYAKELPKEYLESVVHPYALYTIQNGRRIDPEISTLGAVGCYLSHVELWKQLLDSGEEVMHVLEDDATVLATVKQINKFIRSVPSDWDVIYLGFEKMHLDRKRDISLPNGVHKINSWTFQTHSYLIHRRGAEKLLRKVFPITHQVDSYMSFMAMNGGLNAYRPTKQMIKQPYNLNSQVGKGVNIEELFVTITRLPATSLILLVLISLFIVVSFLIKKSAKLVR